MSQTVNPNYVDDTSSLPMWVMGATAVVLFLGVLWLKRGNEQEFGGTLLAPGSQLPQIQAAGWINGEEPTAESLSDKIIVLEVWAPSCSICWRLAPELVRVQEKFADRGVEFIGLTSRTEFVLDEIEEFVQHNKIPWRNGYGAQTTVRDLGVRSLPALWIIGRDGKIAWNHKSEEPFLEALERLTRKATASVAQPAAASL